MKLFIIFILFNAAIINIVYARSLQELYEDMEIKAFEFRQKDFINTGSNPPPAFIEKAAPELPPPVEMPKKNPGFGKLARGRFVPLQTVASLAKEADLLTKPKTVSTILNRLRANRRL